MKRLFSLTLLLLIFLLTGCTEKTVNVTFAREDLVLDVVRIEKNTKVKRPDVSKLEHKFFVGWYKDKGFENQFDFDTLVTNDTTLYAKYEDILYSIYLNLNDGSVNSPYVTAPYGEGITKPEDPVRQGYMFKGWYTNEYGNGEPYEFTTMPAGDGRILRNRIHFPKYPISDYSIGIKDESGNLTKHTSEKIIELYRYNLTTLEGKYRGNTHFQTKLVPSESDPNVSQVVYTGTGITYDRQAALYIHENKLAYVYNIEDESLSSYRLQLFDDELLYGYNVHLNSSTSPVTTNPFMRSEDYAILSGLYRLKYTGTGEKYYSYETPQKFDVVYDLLFCVQEAINYNNPLQKLVDQNNDPYLVGGYHAIDKDGKFLYDENNQPIRALEDIQPKNNDELFFVMELYAAWTWVGY